MLRCSRNLARAAPVWNYRRLSTLPATVRSLLSLETPPEEDVVVHGWVRHFRKQKKFCFLDLSDGSSGDVVQVVLPSTDVASEYASGSYWMFDAS
jgi:aspartyl/asparaginyl-tRNA synthetase